ncbi:MAG: flagellar basal body-associated FliL family protein [Proteobacteria bacterium]|nr:flagellar basal body-associated FliL family protein [Pseudomonadota bacterium]
MAEEKENSDEGKESPKKPMGKLLIIVGAVLVIGIAGFFGWSMFMKKGGDDSHKAEASESTSKHNGQNTEEARHIFPLESFIVNLMDNAGTGKKYLKITMELEVVGEAEKKKLENYKTQLKDTILMLLSSRSFEEIYTVEGKLDLKQTLLARINQALGGNVVYKIYFTEFVVQ